MDAVGCDVAGSRSRYVVRRTGERDRAVRRRRLTADARQYALPSTAPARRSCATARTTHGQPFLNGIDFLEVVAADQRELRRALRAPLPGQPAACRRRPRSTAAQLRIDGGVRIARHRGSRPSSRPRAGDHAARRSAPATSRPTRCGSSPRRCDDVPPPGFDPVAVAGRLLVQGRIAPSEFDCAATRRVPAERGPAPHLNYLAKDYASFRRLMLDRLAARCPTGASAARGPRGRAGRAARLHRRPAQLLPGRGGDRGVSRHGTPPDVGPAARDGCVDYHAARRRQRARLAGRSRPTPIAANAAAPAMPAGTRVTDEPTRRARRAGDVSFETCTTSTALTVSRNAMRSTRGATSGAACRRAPQRATLAGSTGAARARARRRARVRRGARREHRLARGRRSGHTGTRAARRPTRATVRAIR